MEYREQMGPYVLYYSKQIDMCCRKWLESRDPYWMNLQRHYITLLDEVKHSVLEHEKLNPPK